MSHRSNLIGALSLLSVSWLAMPIPASALPGAPLGSTATSPAAVPGIDEAAIRVRCGLLPDGRPRPCCPPLLRDTPRTPELLRRCFVHRKPIGGHTAESIRVPDARIPQAHVVSHEERARIPHEGRGRHSRDGGHGEGRGPIGGGHKGRQPGRMGGGAHSGSPAAGAAGRPKIGAGAHVGRPAMTAVPVGGGHIGRPAMGAAGARIGAPAMGGMRMTAPATPHMSAPHMTAPQMAAPQMGTPHMSAPAAAPRMAAPMAAPHVAAPTAAPMAAPHMAAPMPAPTPAAAPAAAPHMAAPAPAPTPAPAPAPTPAPAAPAAAPAAIGHH